MPLFTYHPTLIGAPVSSPIGVTCDCSIVHSEMDPADSEVFVRTMAQHRGGVQIRIVMGGGGGGGGAPAAWRRCRG